MTSRTKPRPRMQTRKDHIKTFPDHADNPVISAVHSPYAVACHPLGLQVYLLAPLAATTVTAQDLALTIARAQVGFDHHNKQPRVDVYTAPQADMEACMAHQRREREHRKQTTGGLGIIPVWRNDYFQAYRNWIFVVGEEACAFESVAEILARGGLTSVKFDWCFPPEDGVFFEDDYDDEFEGWVDAEVARPGEDPLVEPAPVRPEDGKGMSWKEVEEGVMRDRKSFYHLCQDMIGGCIPQCCYFNEECEDCEDGIEHDECRFVVDEDGCLHSEHHINEEPVTGTCVEWLSFVLNQDEDETDEEIGNEKLTLR